MEPRATFPDVHVLYRSVNVFGVTAVSIGLRESKMVTNGRRTGLQDPKDRVLITAQIRPSCVFSREPLTVQDSVLNGEISQLPEAEPK